uniref:Uncharacterized protein n=1 Tax=Rhizophora mucronata TaxID=61149 RepID=A0A2P2MNG9_RHIMU
MLKELSAFIPTKTNILKRKSMCLLHARFVIYTGNTEEEFQQEST